jgi:steroid 5-alpha reductase family enzyme
MRSQAGAIANAPKSAPSGTMTAPYFLPIVLVIAISLSLVMTLAWLLEQRTVNSGWIDATWTFGVGAVGVGSAFVPLASSYPQRRWLVAVAATLWAARLGLHIVVRTTRRSDDPRYADLRRQYGRHASRQMWYLAQKQALVSIPLVLAIFLAAHNSANGLRVQDYIAITLFVAAIGGEAVADWQLQRFITDTRNGNGVCDAGLWRWSRHPNYFFEWLGWLAYPLIAIDGSGAYPWGLLALVAPACMYWLLVHVSGIPPLEKHMLRSRGDAFRAYQARTSAFFPAFPREAAK